MKKAILTILLLGTLAIGVIGCGSNKELSVIGSYLVDYDDSNYLGDDDEAILVVVFSLTPSEKILLDDESMTLKVGGEEITGEVYQYADNILYDFYDSLEAKENTKIAFSFEMEKYLYNENNNFSIEYEIGTKKGEYSYIVTGSTSINKKNIKEAEFLEDISKDIYSNNPTDSLMILSLKWKINDVNDRYDAYRGLSSANQMKYQCFYNGTTSNGNKLLNYFAEGEDNKISISNSGFLNVSGDDPDIKYNLPSFNYDVLEKYYPGIKEYLIKLNEVMNEGANKLLEVKDGYCLPGNVIQDVVTTMKPIEDLLKNKPVLNEG